MRIRAAAAGARSPTRWRAEPTSRGARRGCATWRERARELSPFDFYARLIGADGGRRALIGRLGPEAADAIDEFLALRARFRARRHRPSLAAFLDEVEASEVADQARHGGGRRSSVRVMTVHAAKGLEAPIVFLPDTAGAPSGAARSRNGSSSSPPSPHATLFVWATDRAERQRADGRGARRRAQEAAAGEHRRLLYVAMTRAAERLIVAGFEGAAGPRAGLLVRSHPLRARSGPRADARAVGRRADGLAVRRRRQRRRGGLRPGRRPPWPRPPAWLGVRRRARPPRPRSPPRARRPRPERAPSRAAARALGSGPARACPAAGLAGDRARAATGAAATVPRPATPGACRSSAARRPRRARARGARDAGTRAAVRPAARARKSRSPAHLPRPGAPLMFSGRIDRLAVGEEAIDVVDFKTGEMRRGAARAGLCRAARALSRRIAAALSGQARLRLVGLARDLARVDEIPGAA